MNTTITTPSIESKRSFSKEISRIKNKQQMLTILILLFICLLFWIIVSLFSSQNSSKISPNVQEMARPFNPTLSTEVLDTLETKKVFSEEELSDFPIFIIREDPQTQAETIVELGKPSIVIQPTAVPRSATPQPSTAPIIEEPES